MKIVYILTILLILAAPSMAVSGSVGNKDIEIIDGGLSNSSLSQLKASWGTDSLELRVIFRNDDTGNIYHLEDIRNIIDFKWEWKKLSTNVFKFGFNFTTPKNLPNGTNASIIVFANTTRSVSVSRNQTEFIIKSANFSFDFTDMLNSSFGMTTGVLNGYKYLRFSGQFNSSQLIVIDPTASMGNFPLSSPAGQHVPPQTVIDLATPAVIPGGGCGTLDTFSIWPYGSAVNLPVKLATFQNVSDLSGQMRLTARDSATLANANSQPKTYTGLSLLVCDGDFVGIYSSSGTLDVNTIGAISNTGWYSCSNTTDITSGTTFCNKGVVKYAFYANYTYSDAPEVTIQSPLNTSYGVLSIALNFTIGFGTTPDKCWYRLNNTGNISLPGCANTSITVSNGYNNITVFANSTSGQIGNATVFFTVDTLFPTITIQSPLNTTYGGLNITLNFTATDNGGFFCNRELNDVNTSIPNCNNITFLASSGWNKLKVYVNDSTNIVHASVNFSTDVLGPSVSLVSPTNTSYIVGNISVVFTASDTNNVTTCRYTFDNGLTNTTLSSCQNTTITVNSGYYQFRLYAIDSYGNVGNAQVNFTANYTLLNISAFEEQSTTTVISNFSVFVTDQAGVTITNTTTSGNIKLINLNDLPANQYTVSVSATNYLTRTYYVTTTNGSVTNLDAYLLNTTDGTSVTFFAADRFNTPLENAIIYVQRFVGSTWLTVGTTTTDSSGSAAISIEAGISYRGVGTASGYENVTRIFTTVSTQPVNFLFGTTKEASYFAWLNNQIVASCAKLNATRTLLCSGNDTSGDVTSFSLRVSQVFPNITVITVCNVANTSVPYATLGCALPAQNVTYTYTFSAVTSSGTFPLASGTWVFVSQFNYGVTGVLASFILFIVASFAFLSGNRFAMAAGILFGYLAIVMSWVSGFLKLGDGGIFTVVSLGFVAMIFMYFTAKGDI